MRRPLAGFAAAALLLAALEIFFAQVLAPLENRLLDAFTRWHAQTFGVPPRQWRAAVRSRPAV